MASFFKNLMQAASNLKEYAQQNINLTYIFDDKSYFKEQELNDDTLRNKLGSTFETDTIDGLKYILAQILKGNDMKRYFPDVVICMHKQSGDLKKIAYIIMTQLYPSNKENALMPINLLHKEAQVKEPLRRGDAIRVLTDISVNEVHPFLFEVSKKSANDQNPYVRRISLTALLKITDYTEMSLEEHQDDILNILQTALKDSQLMVQGPALAYGGRLLTTDIKNFLKLIHPNFLRICDNLYLYEDQLTGPICLTIAQYAHHYLIQEGSANLSQDLIVLIRALENAMDQSLVSSQSLAFVNLYSFLKLSQKNQLDQYDLSRIVKVLKRVMSDHHFDKLCALDTISALLSVKSSLQEVQSQLLNKEFIDRLKIKQNEPLEVKMKKISILKDLFINYGVEESLKELIQVTKNPVKAIRIQGIKAIGECGRLLTQQNRQEEIKESQEQQDEDQISQNQTSRSSNKCIGLILQVLIGLLKQQDDQVMTESMIALQKMIVKDSEQSHAIILYCIKMLDKITSGRAKATMIYLLKEFIDRFPSLSKETLRRLTKGFVQEQDEQVKQQIMNLACKVLIKNKDDDKVRQIFDYLMKVASYDKSLLLRQKSRMLQHIFDQELNIDAEKIFEGSFNPNQKLAASNIVTVQAKQNDNSILLEEQKNKLNLLIVGSFSMLNLSEQSESQRTKEQALLNFMKTQKANEQERIEAQLHRRMIQEERKLGQSASIGTLSKQQLSQQEHSRNQNITSISSEQFSSLNNAQRNNSENQNYRQSHFTVKEAKDLKQDYENFFSQPTELIGDSQGLSQNSKDSLSPDKKNKEKQNSPQRVQDSKTLQNKKADDEYEYYDEDGEGSTQKQ